MNDAAHARNHCWRVTWTDLFGTLHVDFCASRFLARKRAKEIGGKVKRCTEKHAS